MPGTYPDSTKKGEWLLWVFIALSLLNLFAEFRSDRILIYLSKPALLSILSIYFFLNTLAASESQSGRSIRFSRLMLAGLIFSAGGDTLLMFVENSEAKEAFFVAGLASFLLAHLCYLSGFLSFRSSKRGFLAGSPGWIIVFGLFLLADLLFLWSDLPGALKLPVALYSAAIIAMALSCLNLQTRLPGPLFTGLMTGVLLFIFSDSLIAIDKFKGHVIEIPGLRIWIMCSYLISQFLISTRAVQMSKMLENGSDSSLVPESPDGHD